MIKQTGRIHLPFYSDYFYLVVFDRLALIVIPYTTLVIAANKPRSIPKSFYPRSKSTKTTWNLRYGSCVGSQIYMPLTRSQRKSSDRSDDFDQVHISVSASRRLDVSPSRREWQDFVLEERVDLTLPKKRTTTIDKQCG